MGNIIVHFEQLGVPIGTVRDKQFDIQVIAFVEVVCRKCSLNLDFAVA
jgi:predicted nucleic-acid-binding Zn-ribbon protein